MGQKNMSYGQAWIFEPLSMLHVEPISNVMNIVVEVGSFETKIKTETKTSNFLRPVSRDHDLYQVRSRPVEILTCIELIVLC